MNFMKNKNKRWIVFAHHTRKNAGAGLISVFAPTRAKAIRCGNLVIGKRPYKVSGVWSYRKYAAKVRVMAIDAFIATHSKL